MMDWGYGGMMGGGLGQTYGFLTWLALIVFLVLGSLYFWKGINKKD